MAKSWRALPLPTDPRVLVKAPTFAIFEESEHALSQGHFFLPKKPHGEKDIAMALMDSVEDIKALGLGEEFRLYRYAQGLGVRAPSGWTFMVPYDMAAGKPVEKAEKAAIKGNPRPRGKAAGTGG